MAKRSKPKKEALVEVDLPDGRKLAFDTVEEIAKWFQDEQEAWTWLQTVNVAPRQLRQHVISVLNGHWSRIDSQIINAKSPPDEAQIARIKSAITNGYVSASMILSDSAAGKFVIDLKDREPVVAMGVIATLMRNQEAVDALDAIRGVAKAVNFEDGLGDDAPRAAKAAFDEMLTTAQNQLATFQIEQKGLRADTEAVNDRATGQLGEQETAHSKLVAKHTKVLNQNIEWAEEAVKNITETYDKKLALQAPVEYWREKQRHHIKASKWFAVVTLVAGIGGGLLLVWLVGDFLAPPDPTPGVATGSKTGETPAIPWQSIGQTIVAVSLVLWGLRILVRLLLSNVHLATDASERVVMAMTYLALIREGKLPQGENLDLILRALFRTTTTGIVRDDAGPPLIEFAQRVKEKTTGT